MKKSALLLFFILPFSILQANSGLIENKYFGRNSGNLRMFIHKPLQEKNSGEAKPLVLVLHGCGQTARTISRQSGWNKLAGLHDFIVVYPQQKRINNPSGCFNWFFGGDTQKGKGEVSSLANMIQNMRETHHIDSTRIFVVGFSAGAAMASALMACYPAYINTGAIFAGVPYGAVSNPFSAIRMMVNPYYKTPDRWGNKVINQNPAYHGNFPKLVAVHGRKDWVVNINNSLELIKQFTYLHHLDTIEPVLEKAWKGWADIDRSVYRKSEEEKVIFYHIARLGHALAIRPGRAANEGGRRALFAVKRDFHMSYIIAGDFGLLR